MTTTLINQTIIQILVPQHLRLDLAHGYFNQTWFRSNNTCDYLIFVAPGAVIRRPADDKPFSGTVVRLVVHLMTS